MKYRKSIKSSSITHAILLFALLTGLPLVTKAQTGKKFTISGYVIESSNGEAIIGAVVTIREPLKGTVTNNYGFFQLLSTAVNIILVLITQA